MATTAYVWVWLPEAREPVVAGRLDDQGAVTTFTYGRRYLDRADAIALYEPELPLRPGVQAPALGTIAGCLADVGPDAWGRRVLEHRGLVGDPDRHPLPYLLAGDASRIGGLDVTDRADTHDDRRPGPVPLGDLLAATERLERGDELDARLELALRHGTSVGGARPKAHLEDADGRALIAKFGRSTDTRPVAQAEFVAMELARRAGLEVAPVRLEQVHGKEVLLVERFDRPGGERRRLLVSARTILGLGPQGIGASYADLADQVRARFTDPVATVHELFARITFNILIGNTDDHARNHAAFWDGSRLTLTPAYDLCPRLRTGGEASQAMAIGPDGYRLSQLAGCVERSAHYLLDPDEARAIIDHQLAVIRRDWAEVTDDARLGRAPPRPAVGSGLPPPLRPRGLVTPQVLSR